MKKPLIDQWKAEEQQPFGGWDFSHLDNRLIHDSPPWSYWEIARQLLTGVSSCLDIGTGGGERLLELQDVFPEHMVASEGFDKNLPVARDCLEPLGVKVVDMESSMQASMPFEDNTFDLVINRHSAYNARELKRVIRPGGTFHTQQVDGHNMADLSACFDATQPWTFLNRM